MSRLIGVNERGHRVGEDHPQARYTDRNVAQVFELAEEGWGCRRISRSLECSKTWVRKVLRGDVRSQQPARFKRCT